jgi:DNA-binding CsgD family transcriptional regulator
VLEGVGLTKEQEQTYRHLLAQPQLTIAEVQAQQHDPSAAYTEAVLASLVDAGLAVRTGTDSYAAISPDVAIAGLVRGRVDAARRVEYVVPELMATFWEGRQADSRDFVDVVTDQDSIIDRWYQLQRAARQQVRGFDCPPYFADPVEPDPLELERLAQGVSYRVIYADEVLQVPGRWRDLEAGISAGEQARVIHRLPVKLTLFDDFAATLPMTDGPALDGTMSKAVIVVHRSPMLDSLSALFESYWEQAVPLAFGSDGVPVTARSDEAVEETRLVRLLAAGFGNDHIQRVLGVSASTVQRRVHELMARLGAKTRFQAGLMLGRRSAGHPTEPPPG